MKQFTFNELCTSLKKKASLSENVDAVKTIFGSAAVLLGDAAVGNVAGFIHAVFEKEKLIDLGKMILQKILDKNPVNYVTKIDQMKEAYGLICFTAFFDAMDHVLSDNIRNDIDLSLKEKEVLFQDSIARESVGTEQFIQVDQKHSSHHMDKKMRSSLEINIIFPDIVYSSTKVDEHLREMYEIMAGTARGFVEKLSFQEQAKEKEIRIFEEAMANLPENAVKQFHEQYLYLCSHFEEFYVFAQMEREKERELEDTERYRTLSSFLRDVDDKIDTGLGRLTELITTLPGRVKEKSAGEIAESLAATYRSSIEKPLVDSRDEDEKLVYPLISKAFIPQIYKLLRYTGKEKLELTNTWDRFKRQKDMTLFWTKYYLDPDSVENILLILGEPGIGKSLLTKVLCARMCSDKAVFIRIPLREHDMEEGIESIVLKQLKQDGDPSVPVPTFKWFAEEFPDNPITLVFDGYDEVLQATGGVYRKLLKEIHNFQKSCCEHKRPVRVIVTSRETLIDKADIPFGSLVMKLLEFDDDQKIEWIDIWNEHNQDILAEEGLEDFQLPENNTDIEKLSGQPLLLLMLAIYDANFELNVNSLTTQKGQEQSFNRSMLYDELLRRFVRRELRKGPKGEENAFDEADEYEQEEMVNEEMRKLGIAALGMFVREKLSLTADELDCDLEYMEVKSTQYSVPNRIMLKKAEIIFGSFFFIHHSKMENEEDEKDATFEFLHKTFYEFLTADLILVYLIEAVDNMYFYLDNQKRSKGEELYRKEIENPDSFSLQYYAALNGVCFCTEPEIIRMLAEWKNTKIAACTREEPNFQNTLPRIMKDIFVQHAHMIQEHTFVLHDSKWSNGSLAEDKNGKSFPQSCAVYLINLLTLQILICGECEVDAGLWSFVSQYFKLNAPLSQKTESERLKSRDRISNLEIPSSEEIILKFMALFDIRKKEDSVILKQKRNDRIKVQNDLIDARAEVFDFLQDDITRMVYELHDVNIPGRVKQEYRTYLRKKGADLNFEVEINCLMRILEGDYQSESYIRSVGHLIARCFKEIGMRHRDEELVLGCLLRIREVLDKLPDSVLRLLKMEISNDIDRWDKYADIIIHTYTKEIVYIFLDIAKKIGREKELLTERLIYYIIDNPDVYSPDIACRILDNCFYGGYETISVFRHAIDRWDKGIFEKVYKSESPKHLAAVLKICGVYFQYQIPDYIFNAIQTRWDEYLRKRPEELSELLRIYLQFGKFNQVREFFKHRSQEIANRVIIRNNWARTQTLIDEFLEIAEQVCIEREFLLEIFRRLEERAYHVYPCIFMKELYYVLKQVDYSQSVVSLGNTFLRLYEKTFFSYTNESVNILYYLVKNRRLVDEMDTDLLHRACLYNLQYYMYILEKSVNTAAHALQIWFDFGTVIQKNISDVATYKEEHINPGRNINVRLYATKCFDKALLNRKRVDENALIELLNSIDFNTRCELYDYFKDKYFYFTRYSEKVSQAIDRMYGGSL